MATFSIESTGKEVVEAFEASLQGKTVLITGASAGGLGADTARTLAHAHPAHILLLGRSANKVQPVMDDIKAIDPNIQTTFIPISLDYNSSIRKAASQVLDSASSLDIIINNAGIMAVPNYTLSADGIESQLASNHIGHFLLTNLLLPKLPTNPHIVNVSSDGHLISPFRLSDPNFSSGATYDDWSAYGQSKTANILFTIALAQRGLHAISVHPGVISTNLGRHLGREDFARINDTTLRNTGKPFAVGAYKTPQQGVATIIRAALDPHLTSGSYLQDCNVHEAAEYATDKGNAEKVWKLSEELVGEEFSGTYRG